MEPDATRAVDSPGGGPPLWAVPVDSLAFGESEITSRLLELDRPCFVVQDQGRIGVSHQGHWRGSASRLPGHAHTSIWAPPLPITALGDPAFRESHGVRYSYYTGAMANGIASEDLVIALGGAGILGCFGAAGLLPARIEAAIARACSSP